MSAEAVRTSQEELKKRLLQAARDKTKHERAREELKKQCWECWKQYDAVACSCTHKKIKQYFLPAREAKF